jgi:Putative Flp pilus-assembly TadE/G-like
MVMMAAILPVMIIFAGFVIDIANWFQHDRHLQTQADAAALAGALNFMSCPNNTPIQDKVDEYSGSTWNAQVGDTQGNVHVLLNSPTYYNQPGKIDSTVVEGPPCTANMVDVKVTETDLPWWFALGDVDFLNAHARVQLRTIDSLAGAAPLGVPDVNPVRAKAIFIDESKALSDPTRVLGSKELTRQSYSNGMAVWDNSGDALGLDVNAERIGVRIALSGGDETDCGEELVECYDMDPAENGVLYARGWSDEAATLAAPKARDVRLVSEGTNPCPDPYFSNAIIPCTIGVQATLDFAVPNPSSTTVTAEIGNQTRNLTFVSMVPGTTNSIWRTGTGTGSNAPLTIDPAAGPVGITMNWRRSGNDRGSFGVVQRIFSASSARSGPIKLAQLWEGGSFGVNSVQRCTATNTSCHHDFVVKVGITGTFEDLYNDLSTVTTPVTLRLAGGDSGSQNQALDCDPWADPTTGGNVGFEEELARGCRPSYTQNKGTSCPASPQTLWGTSTSPADQGSPWQCVAVETGDRSGQLGTGMNLRVLGSKNPSTCPSIHQNNWPDTGVIGDRRIIHVFLTQFGAFDASGQNTVAVTGFASFYVTGWRGQGNADKNPCQDPDKLEDPSRPDDPVAESATVVGHFIKYRGPIEGTPSNEACDLNDPTPCISALVE